MRQSRTFHTLANGPKSGVQLKDYEKLYWYLFEKCVDDWRASFTKNARPDAQLLRVYWYVVGAIDEWDLADPKAQAHLRKQFENDRDVRAEWSKAASQSLQNQSKPQTQQAVLEEAWALCFRDFQSWYEGKKQNLDGMNQFHYAVAASTDFIEVRKVGHWKVNFLDEKGVDTSFAVDMVTMLSAYDVALLISGDADSIPSVNYVKNSGRHVGAVEFLKGYPPEDRAKNVSAKLKVAADFVTPIYEMDLVREGIGQKP